MNKKFKVILIVLFGLAFVVFLYFFVKNFPEKNPLLPKAATVNGITVTKDELNKKLYFTKNFYEFSKQNLTNYPTLEKDALERLIEDKLVEDYAKKHNITVSEEEVLALYKQKLANKTESELLAQLKNMYGMEKSDYLLVLKNDILREKVQAAIKMPLATWLNEQKKTANINILK